MRGPKPNGRYENMVGSLSLFSLLHLSGIKLSGLWNSSGDLLVGIMGINTSVCTNLVSLDIRQWLAYGAHRTPEGT